MDYAYCNVCRHHIYDMAKHLETEEHRRHLRVITRGGLKPPSKPTTRRRKRYGGYLSKELGQ